jgi:hypothetical protein
MKRGTKSLLFGVHQFIIHPIIVAIAWYKLYGFPFDPRIWVAFIVHDWGYWGCSQMDGEEGDNHPYLGANLMHYLFDGHRGDSAVDTWNPLKWIRFIIACDYEPRWYNFCLCHSRFLAKQKDLQPSKLCMADKLAVYYYPNWLYIFLAKLSGELWEYLDSAKQSGKHGHMNLNDTNPEIWLNEVKQFLYEYAFEHKDGKIDKVTKI